MILKSLRTISLTVLILSTSLLSGCQKAESTSLKPSKEMTSSVDKEITTYEEAIESNPDIILSYISLGHLYLQKIRETADISYYAKIETLMNEAERSDPDDPDIYALRAQVLIGQHRFREGNALIKKSVALNPTKASFQGILGDSEIELGNYTGAVDAFQKMVDIRPDYSSHMRIAYIRELYGDRAGAEESIRLALKMGNTIPENMAFTHVELGKLIMRRSLEESK